MIVRVLLDASTARLAEAGVPSPGVDAELLLAHVLQVDRSRLSLAPEPDGQQVQTFEQLVERRAVREPLQHLTGATAFRYVDVEVGPGVFVPRPETEMLAGWALDVLASRAAAEQVVVDLCTGSGAIAAAIAHETVDARVHAVEIDDGAYAYARRNLDGTGVDLRQGDIADAFADLDGGVDLVVANPPYIPVGAWETVAPEARDHDPSIALWSGEDGLDAIRVVERVAHRLLVPGGRVGCEHADLQGESAPEVFVTAGRWAEVRDRTDLVGRPRFVTAVRV